MINLGNITIADLWLGTIRAKSAWISDVQVWSDAPAYLCFTADEANSTVHFDKVGSPGTISLETSTDGSTWTDYSWTDSTGDTLTLANVGDKVYMRAKTENQTIGSSSSNYYKFIMTGKIAASGNIQTLLKVDGSRTDAPAYCYFSMFQDCTSLTTAPQLPATTLANYCYRSIFQGCTSLMTAPKLPATTLAGYCYYYMFKGCTSLTTAPALPATTLAIDCYDSMFSGCTSLTSAPQLPATTLAAYCYYYMFQGCSALTAAPALPATTLAAYCYSNMFVGCTALTTAPALPATTLANSCYANMFSGCTALTTAPALPATTLANSCYANMFYGCTSLSSVEVAFTEWTSGATTDWLLDVAASGTFTCPPALPDTRGTSNIPYNWTKNSSYVKDGLICWYDGINNYDSNTHSSSATVWTNLGTLGSNYNATRDTVSWQDNGAIFSGSTGRFNIPNSLMSSQMKGEWTYEIVFTPTNNWLKNYSGLFGNHGSSGRGIVGGQYVDGNITFSTYQTWTETVQWQPDSTYFQPYINTLNIIGCAASDSAKTSYIWHNGELKNALATGSFNLTNTDTTYIGAAYPDSNRIFEGVIHCVRIYNRQLTEQEHMQNVAVDISRFS